VSGEKQFEKSAQELFKETWELFWSITGVIGFLLLVFGGIYFSQIAISFVIGTAGFLYYFSWALSVTVSALEVSAIKIFGNKERSLLIKSESSSEHNIVLYGTWALFVFDIITNISGLYLSAQLVRGAEGVHISDWIIIIMSSFIMAFAEVGVGWMMRSVGTSYVSWKYAKSKFKSYSKQLDVVSNSSATRDIYSENYQKPQSHNNRRQQ